MEKTVLALFSPNENRYTETFVQAHKRLLDFDTRYLYGGFLPQFAEHYGPLTGQSFVAKVIRNLENYLSPAGRLTNHEKAIIRYLKAEKVEVALAEFGITGAKIWRACREAGVPLVVHFHGFDVFDEITVNKYLPAYQQMFSYISSMIGVSREMCAQLHNWGVPKEKIFYTPCGPNPNFFTIQPSYSTHNLIAVGRLITKKSPDITVQAFAQAVAQIPELRLRIGGEGPLLARCQALAKSLNIEDKIEFAGVISPAQVQEWLSDALAFVQHSVTAPGGDREGTPVAVLEASAAGLPVISTRHAGIPDVIIDGKTGILVDEHDVTGFADAMVRIAREDGLAQKLGRAGRENVSAHFSMDHHIAIIDGALRKAINDFSAFDGQTTIE